MTKRVEVLFLRGAPAGCVVEQADTGGTLTARFEVVCDGDKVGFIKIARRKLLGRSVWNVQSIRVVPAAQRKGYATMLYTAAAAFACKKRSRLASSVREVGAHSLDFWLKQERKGRATRFRRPRLYEWNRSTTNYTDVQKANSRSVEADIYDAFILNECGPRIDLSGVPRRRINARTSRP
jgi:GNAT superfamily N-acetyltransferase